MTETEFVHGLKVTADEVVSTEVRADVLDRGMEYHGERLETCSATILGELVVVLSEPGNKPLNVAVHLAADGFLPPVRGTAFVFGLDFELEGGFLCLPESAERGLERAARVAAHPRALETIRERARMTGLQAFDLMAAVDELKERSR